MAAHSAIDALTGNGRILAIAVILSMLAACQSTTGPKVPGAWISPIGQNHPLAGRIWKAEEGRFVSVETMMTEIESAQFVLTGEKHDNPDHHLIQARLIETLHRRERGPVTVIEMVTTEQQADLDAFQKGHPASAQGLDDVLKWSESGWPDWSIYRPVFETALATGRRISAASMPRPSLRAIAKDGTAALGTAEVDRLGLTKPLPEELRERLRVEIIESHCGMAHESMIDPLATVLAVRDAFMAHALIEAVGGDDDVAVLIAGGGHARTDIAVPWHLLRAKPTARVVSIGLVEVTTGQDDPGAYAQRFGSDRNPFDYVWFTARADDTDPCEKYADQLKKMRHGTGNE